MGCGKRTRERGGRRPREATVGGETEKEEEEEREGEQEQE